MRGGSRAGAAAAGDALQYGRTISDLTGVPASVADQLPPDEETLGFDNIATAYSVSTLHAARYLDVAEVAAAALAASSARLTAVAGCDPTAGDAACVDSFIAGFGRRAWRRPLDTDELQAMQKIYTDTAEPSAVDGIAGVAAAMLQAPQFLYRPEPATATTTTGSTTTEPIEPYALATRLSFLLTGAGPDDALLSAAGSGGLDSEDGLLAQTDRLLQTHAPGSCSCTSRNNGGSWATSRPSTRTAACTGRGRTPRPARSPRRRGCSSPTPGGRSPTSRRC